MALSVGARLGPYELIAPLGAGGMGEVYRARDSRLERTVAIKILPPDAQRPDTIDRFRREGRVLSRLSHPHICSVHDVGEENGVAFLVMEYLEGDTLADRLVSGPLPLEQALRHAHHVATALDEAHRQGVVHRDLKPGNIMLTRAGVKVLDFGLAKLREAEDDGSEAGTRSVDLTAEGAVVGTVPYMAPEQLEGRPADARTDIFAFGVVVYEMVTGTRPFKGNNRASIITAILASEPELINTLRPMAPLLLDRVVRRCLAKDPEERWQTARDLAAELMFILEAGSQAGLAPPEARRRRGRSLLVGGLVGAMLAAGIVAALLARSPTRAIPTFHRLTFRTGYLTGGRFAPDGETIVYGASWDGRPPELFLGRLGSTEARPLGLKEGRVLSISRSGEMALIRGGSDPYYGTLTQAPLAGGVPRELLQDVFEADWIADTNQLAALTVERDGTFLEFPLGTKVWEAASFVGYMRVSPRGDLVALLEWRGGTMGRGDVIVVDRAGKKKTLSRGWVGLWGLAWSPSGDEVWFSATRPSVGEGPPAIRAVSLSGKERLVTRAPTWLFLNEVFRDGRVLLASNFARAGVRCLLPGEVSEREMGWLDSSHVQEISSDGKTLLFGEGGRKGLVPGVFGQGVAGGAPSGAVYLRKTDGSPAIRLGEGYPFDLSPDGKWALVAQADGKELTLLPTGPGMPKRLPLGQVTITWVGQWLDDRRITFAGAEPGRSVRTFVQDIETGTIRPVSPEGTYASNYALVAPGGKAVLVGSQVPWLPGDYQLYPVDGGDPRPLPFAAPATPLAWNSDGRSLYVTDVGYYQRARNIYRQDVATGRRQLWKTLAPPDPAGVDSIWPVVLTPDGSCYCYTYTRTLGTLYVVEGLK